MKREFIEKHLAAYLDGELPESLREEFEHELAAHPDLQAEIKRWRELDQIAKASETEMPAEGYFDSLAERIDARVAQVAGEPRPSLIERILRPSPRVVKLVGSVAAVLLVAVVGWEVYGPATRSVTEPIRITAPETRRADKESKWAEPIATTDSAVEERRATAPIAEDTDETIADLKIEMPSPVPDEGAGIDNVVPPVSQQLLEEKEELNIRGGRAAEITLDAATPAEEKVSLREKTSLEEPVVAVDSGAVRHRQEKPAIQAPSVELPIPADSGRVMTTPKSDEATAYEVELSDESAAVKSVVELQSLSQQIAPASIGPTGEGVIPEANIVYMEIDEAIDTDTLTEVQFDTLIKVYDSQETENGHLGAANLSYLKAERFRTLTNVDQAIERLNAYLSRPDATNRALPQRWLEQLAVWRKSLK